VFNLKVKYYNRTRLPTEVEEEFNVEYCSTLESLLNVSDIVSIHTPQNRETEGLISTREFSQMKDGVFFINTSRGPVVDEDALIVAIESGKVRRAGLDVFKKEPEINEYFKKSERCTIQPHLGGLTNNSWMKAERECVENLRQFFKTGYPVAPVNEIKK
jgi:lactate dehydrogenase-like 2-hydroxyacid dehydrogenase